MFIFSFKKILAPPTKKGREECEVESTAPSKNKMSEGGHGGGCHGKHFQAIE
jgi:hypothetical protein